MSIPEIARAFAVPEDVVASKLGEIDEAALVRLASTSKATVAADMLRRYENDLAGLEAQLAKAIKKGVQRDITETRREKRITQQHYVEFVLKVLSDQTMGLSTHNPRDDSLPSMAREYMRDLLSSMAPDGPDFGSLTDDQLFDVLELSQPNYGTTSIAGQPAPE